MTIQEVQAAASIVQSVFVAFGVIWTVVTFWALGNVARARADLQRIELDLKRQAVIEIDIEATQQSVPGDPARFFSAVVDVANKGSRNTRLAFNEDGPFHIRTVTIRPDGNLTFGTSANFPVVRASDPGGVPAPSMVVRAGGREQVPFFFRVDRPGLYFLTFAASLSPSEHEVAREQGVQFETSWVAKKYLIVD